MGNIIFFVNTTQLKNIELLFLVTSGIHFSITHELVWELLREQNKERSVFLKDDLA